MFLAITFSPPFSLILFFLPYFVLFSFFSYFDSKKMFLTSKLSDEKDRYHHTRLVGNNLLFIWPNETFLVRTLRAILCKKLYAILRNHLSSDFFNFCNYFTYMKIKFNLAKIRKKKHHILK